MDTLPTTLKDLITLGMGAGGVWLSVKVMTAIKQTVWSADTCVYVGMGLAGVIGIGFWALGGAMGYVQFPATVGDYWWRTWIEAVCGVGFTTAILAKVYYDKVYHPLEKSQ